jgi:hypothetical protein
LTKILYHDKIAFIKGYERKRESDKVLRELPVGASAAAKRF